uniref:Uncharacterized protein n=1 Tax=Melon chlorotic spot virus TaxID=2479459 RepID=A0A481T1C1_9VIRU|nr:hypothetical protein [Melon chlorotic spot virus]
MYDLVPSCPAYPANLLPFMALVNSFSMEEKNLGYVPIELANFLHESAIFDAPVTNSIISSLSSYGSREARYDIAKRMLKTCLVETVKKYIGSSEENFTRAEFNNLAAILVKLIEM